MDQRWTKIRQLFRAALDVNVQQREAFLMEQCPDDPDIRNRVESMLKAYDNDDTFLESPVANLGQHFASKKGHESLVGTKIGPYQIKRVIAQGGMGVVFESLDTKLEKVVALKMMNPALMQDMSFKLRFEQEAKTLARLEDPHFVRVHALIEENHNTFIVMEYIHGITLAEHIRAKGKLTDREVARVGLQLLTALGKAHKQNIIHRDLKPSNIMLTRSDDGKLLVKVLDFGIAKNIQHSKTVTRTMGTVGTLYYMSPEQIRALPNIDHRTDIYSLGVTLFEALNGALPFDITKDEFTIRKQIVEGKILAASAPKNSSSTPVESILAKALEIDPAKRYQSADKMRAALLSALREPGPLDGSTPQNIAAPPLPKKKRPYARFVLPALAALILIPLALYMISGGSLPFQQAPANAEQTLSENTTSNGSESVSPASVLDTITTTPAIIPIDSLVNQRPGTPDQDSTIQTAPPVEDTQISTGPAPTPAEELDDLTESDDPPEDSIPLLASADTLVSQNPDSSSEAQDTTTAQPPPETGTITLLIGPPSNLIVDNIDYGSVVVEPLTLTADYHRFVIQNNEYGTWECSLFIPADQSIERNVLFNQPISIPVAAREPDSTTYIRNASILLDGSPTGFQTPMTLKVSPGLHAIGAQLDGYTLEDVQIEGAEGCFQKVNSRINFDSSINYKDKRVIVILRKSDSS